MNAVPWNKVRRIFEAAIDCPAHRRDRLLSRACRGDEELRRQVTDLLDQQPRDDDWLASPFPGAATNLLELSHLVGAAEKIGPYRVGEVIAIGGMGVVLRAVDESAETPRSVAIKLLPRELCTRRTLRAFRREQRLLEQLDHPNITRLLDAGIKPDGQPYIVMEFVDGRPIDEYVRTHNLSVNQRLSLFRSVCMAVHYAHQNLIVHRDLKPANILIDENGIVKLLDFGIAKLLRQDAQPAVSQTVTMMDAMTLQYSSPEQIRGEVITTATDVYSLGVILYELLTGSPPYELSRTSRYEAEKTICESPPRGLRTASSIAKAPWGPALERIVMMAMHKDARQRYGSAEQLSEDIRRYLDGSAVMAYKPGRFESVISVVRKHRAVFGVAAASFVIVTALAIGLGIAAKSAATARDREMKARLVSQRINGFMNELLATARPDPLGMTSARVQVLGEASALVERELGDQPDIAASVYMQIGQTQFNLRRDADAIRNFRSALACLRRSRATDKEQLAECLGSLGAALSYRDDEEGLALQQEALEVRRLAYGENDLRVAASMHGLGFALTRCARPPRYNEAEVLYRDALEMRRRLGAEESAATAENLHALAALKRHQGRLEESAEYYEQALALIRRVLQAPNGQLIDCLNDYAACLRDLRQYDRAEALLKESASHTSQLLGEVAAAATISNLASITREQGDRPEAWRLINQALARLCRAASTELPGLRAEKWREITSILNKEPSTPLIETYRDFIKCAAIDFASNHVPPSTYCCVLGYLAELALHDGEFQLAEQASREAIRALDAHDPDDQRIRTGLQQSLADALIGLNQPDEARMLLLQVVNVLNASRGPDHRETRAASDRLDRLNGKVLKGPVQSG